jgi:hypothetical protein
MSIGVSLIASLNKLGIDIFCLKCCKEDFDVNWRAKINMLSSYYCCFHGKARVRRAAAPRVYSVDVKHFSVPSTL